MSKVNTAEHMIDILTQENNANNEIPADSVLLQGQATANSLVPKVLQGVNGKLSDLVTNILSEKRFVSTAGYDDKSDETESGRDTGAQKNQIIRDVGVHKTSNRDAGAQQATENMDSEAQNCEKEKDINTPQIIRYRVNDTDSTNNKSFDNLDELLLYQQH